MSASEDHELKVSQAYQVIGYLAHVSGLFDHPEVQRALDYFSEDRVDEDFLPWGAGIDVPPFPKG